MLEDWANKPSTPYKFPRGQYRQKYRILGGNNLKFQKPSMARLSQTVHQLRKGNRASKVSQQRVNKAVPRVQNIDVSRTSQ